MIQNKQDLKKYLEMDKTALHPGRKHPRLFGDNIWKYEIALRKHEYYVNRGGGVGVFAKMMRKYYAYLHYRRGMRLGFEIPVNTVGAGLRLFHQGSIIIHPRAKVGEWCGLLHDITIGQGMTPDDVPVVGNNVIILAGAKLFGKIVIGDDVMIGANAVVNKSFPEGHCRIAGIPAKIISSEGNVWVNGRNELEWNWTKTHKEGAE